MPFAVLDLNTSDLVADDGYLVVEQDEDGILNVVARFEYLTQAEIAVAALNADEDGEGEDAEDEVVAETDDEVG